MDAEDPELLLTDIAGPGGLKPLFELLLEHIPAPEYDDAHPLQALVTNLDASPYVGRLALCRMRHGTLRKGQMVAWCRADETIENVKITELYVTEMLDRVDALEVGPGEIIAIAGLPDVTIGETLADVDDPRPLPVIHVDDPSLSMTIGINTSPLSGQDGSKLTARQVKSRLDAELVGNVSLRVLNTDRPDAWEVQGRGELQLAVLVEMMRREGFELTVGKPEVVTREINGKVHEPMEHVTIDVPEDYLGVVTQMLALRKGRMEQMVNHGTGWVRMEYVVPARGLIGFRTEFMTETRGTGMLHHVFERYEPWQGELRTRPTGSLVADRRGYSNTFALMNLQERGQMLVGPAVEVYEGMIVGENAALRRHGRQHHQGEEAHQHARRGLRQHGAPRAAAADVARAGARVHRRRRVRRGDPAQRPAAQGRARRQHPRPHHQEPEPRASSFAVQSEDAPDASHLRSGRHASASVEPGRVPADHAGRRDPARDHHRDRRPRCASRRRGSGARRGRTAPRASSPRTRRPTRTSGSSRSTGCSPAWCRSR